MCVTRPGCFNSDAPLDGTMRPLKTCCGPPSAPRAQPARAHVKVTPEKELFFQTMLYAAVIISVTGCTWSDSGSHFEAQHLL